MQREAEFCWTLLCLSGGLSISPWCSPPTHRTFKSLPPHIITPPRRWSQPSVSLFTLHIQHFVMDPHMGLPGSLLPHHLHCHNTTDSPTPYPPQARFPLPATESPSVSKTSLFHLLQAGFCSLMASRQNLVWGHIGEV